MTRVFVVVFAIGVTAAHSRPAHAIATPPVPAPTPAGGDPADAVFDLMSTGRFSEALRAVRAALLDADTSWRLHYAHAQLLLSISDYTLAVSEAERAAELADDSADAWSLLASCLQVLGEDARARTAVARALTLEPAHEWALQIDAELTLHERIRSGAGVVHAPGGPSHLVNQLLREAQRPGGLAAALKRHLDPALLRSILTQLKVPERDQERVLGEIASGMRQAMNPGQSTFHGFLVEPEATVDARGGTRVRAHFLMTRRFRRDDVERMKRIYDTPAIQSYLDPDQLSVLRGLDAADRAAFYQRVETTDQLTAFDLDFIVASRGPGAGWHIREVAMLRSDGSEVLFSQIMGNLEQFARAAGGARPRGLEDSPSTAYQIGRLVGMIVVLLLVVYAVDRLRRRAR